MLRQGLTSLFVLNILISRAKKYIALRTVFVMVDALELAYLLMRLSANSNM